MKIRHTHQMKSREYCLLLLARFLYTRDGIYDGNATQLYCNLRAEENALIPHRLQVAFNHRILGRAIGYHLLDIATMFKMKPIKLLHGRARYVFVGLSEQLHQCRVNRWHDILTSPQPFDQTSITPLPRPIDLAQSAKC